MKLMRNRFQKGVTALIVGWLALFVLLPNLMIFVTSFLTRDDAHFVRMAFTLSNYTRLLDPLYGEVLLHSLNMAVIATLCCLLLGYPFAWCLTKLPARLRPLMQRLIPALCGLLLMLLVWQIAALWSSGFPTPYAT
ncbi:hypothetical protein ABH309_24995, partial [Chromobacterium piscinae]